MYSGLGSATDHRDNAAEGGRIWLHMQPPSAFVTEQFLGCQVVSESKKSQMVATA